MQAAEYPALLQDLVPTIRRLLSEIKPQYMDTPEHVRTAAAAANLPTARFAHADVGVDGVESAWGPPAAPQRPA